MSKPGAGAAKWQRQQYRQMMDTMSSRHDVMGIGGLTKACKRLSEAAKTLSTRHYGWNAIEGDRGRSQRGNGTHSDHRRCGPHPKCLQARKMVGGGWLQGLPAAT
jgi:hypothetical protein